MKFMTHSGVRHRALVVEDDPAIRRLVEKLLIRRGITIDTAHDGRQAIDKLRSNGYAVVVLDLMLLTARLMPMIDLKTYPLYPATALTDFSVFGVSMSRRETRSTMSAESS